MCFKNDLGKLRSIYAFLSTNRCSETLGTIEEKQITLTTRIRWGKSVFDFSTLIRPLISENETSHSTNFSSVNTSIYRTHQQELHSKLAYNFL